MYWLFKIEGLLAEIEESVSICVSQLQGLLKNIDDFVSVDVLQFKGYRSLCPVTFNSS